MTPDQFQPEPGQRYINTTTSEVRTIVAVKIGTYLGDEPMPDTIYYWWEGVPSPQPLSESPAEFAAWADEVLP